jgi:arylsulfatase A-like enzyme
MTKRLVLIFVAIALVASMTAGQMRRRRPVTVSADERSTTEQARPLADAGGSKPNIILILTDDMAARDVSVMPKLNRLLAREGTTFNSDFVTDSLCCPSRSSILRGQFVHDHHTLGNQPPDGGFQKFHATGNETSTIGTWLKVAGYRTGLMGKYLNGYPQTVAENYVPPGWDEWDSPSRGGYGEFDYVLNENGRLVTHGHAAEDFLVDVMARKSVAFIDDAVRAKQPFFLYLATFAPHQPATPAPRHANLFADARAPRDPSFDEANVTAKPQFIRALDPLRPRQIAAIDNLYRKRIQSLQSVDDLIETLVKELQSKGILDRTYIVFTSDNGFHLGQHRMQQGKQTAYETDIHVPLIVRGPGVAAGATRDALVAEIDLAPTFAEWAGLAAPSFVDGRSIVPLLEHYSGSTEPFASPFEEGQRQGARRIPTYQALRTRDMTYVEYETGERELYDLKRDPYELDNSALRADPSTIKALSAQLAALHTCAGKTCRSADAMGQ